MIRHSADSATESESNVVTTLRLPGTESGPSHRDGSQALTAGRPGRGHSRSALDAARADSLVHASVAPGPGLARHKARAGPWSQPTESYG